MLGVCDINRNSSSLRAWISLPRHSLVAHRVIHLHSNIYYTYPHVHYGTYVQNWTDSSIKFIVYMHLYGNCKIFIYDSSKIYRIFQIDVITTLALLNKFKFNLTRHVIYKKCLDLTSRTLLNKVKLTAFKL